MYYILTIIVKFGGISLLDKANLAPTLGSEHLFAGFRVGYLLTYSTSP